MQEVVNYLHTFQEMNYPNLRCRMFRRSPVGSLEAEVIYDVHGVLT